MEELGPTLYDILKEKKFGILELKSIAMLAIELVCPFSIKLDFR